MARLVLTLVLMFAATAAHALGPLGAIDGFASAVQGALAIGTVLLVALLVIVVLRRGVQRGTAGAFRRLAGADPNVIAEHRKWHSARLRPGH